MPWWSINPRLEPSVRKQAAWALMSYPDIYEDGEEFAATPALLSTPTGLAQAYNNAENLGLDLNSVSIIPLSDICDDKD